MTTKIASRPLNTAPILATTGPASIAIVAGTKIGFNDADLNITSTGDRR